MATSGPQNLLSSFEPVERRTVSAEVRDRTVLVNSLSKTYAMTGWRVGYCAAPAPIVFVRPNCVGEWQMRAQLSILLLPMTALLLGLAGTGAVYWQNLTRQANELAEIDAGLLSDDLPINAYLDNGLDSWLKRPHQ